MCFLSGLGYQRATSSSPKWILPTRPLAVQRILSFICMRKFVAPCTCRERSKEGIDNFISTYEGGEVKNLVVDRDGAVKHILGGGRLL